MGNAGSDDGWQRRQLEKAIEREDMRDIRHWSLGITVGLEQALQILWVILKHEPENYDRGRVEWIRKLLNERVVSPEDVGRALDALEPAELDREALGALVSRPYRRVATRA